MNNLVSVIPLKSEGTGRTLTVFLWVIFGLSILSALFSSIEVTAPSIYTQLEIFDGLQAMLSIVIYLIIVVIFLLWMYLLHSYLAVLFDGYPISPKGALARLIIPIYSLWGIWNIFATLADHLKSEADDLASLGSLLRTWLPWLYITLFASNILGNITFRLASSSSGGASPGLLFLTAIVNVCLFIVWLRMAITIRNAVNYKANRPFLQ